MKIFNESVLKVDYSDLDSFKDSILENISDKFDFVDRSNLNYDLLDIKFEKSETKVGKNILKPSMNLDQEFVIVGKNIKIVIYFQLITSFESKKTESSKTITYAGKVNGRSLSGSFYVE